MADLTIDDIDKQVKGKVYTQDYSKKDAIEGVKIIQVKNFAGEDGDFSELIRINDEGYVEDLPEFKVAQLNRSRMMPGTIKGWHLHFEQDDIWYVALQDSLLLGLWDVRLESKTRGISTKIMLGSGQSFLLFVPRGVAHGAANISGKSVEIIYFVNKRFNPKNPDEKRLPWNSLGEEFWTQKRD